MTKTKTYFQELASDGLLLKNQLFSPITPKMRTAIYAFAFLAVGFFSITPAMAASDLFATLLAAAKKFLADINSLVTILATVGVVVSIIGIMIASIFGAKATAVFTSSLKFIAIFFAVWLLVDPIFSYFTDLFGTGPTGGNTSSGTPGGVNGGPTS